MAAASLLGEQWLDAEVEAGKAVKMCVEEQCDEHSSQTSPAESSMTGYRQEMQPREQELEAVHSGRHIILGGLQRQVGSAINR